MYIYYRLQEYTATICRNIPKYYTGEYDMTTFEQLKKSKSKSIESLSKAMEEMDKKASFSNEDDRQWKLTVDKAGNGHAVIRFLPAPGGEDIPFVRIWDHGFQGPTGQWYIEKSLTTLGQQDPVSEYNSKLWNTGDEESKNIARKQKRRLSYYSNIYVVSDPANPENEGKVFLFKYGAKIFEKLKNLMHPEFEDETPVVPFDLWEGANFKLRAKQVAGFRNYDSSEFAAPGPIGDDDGDRERIWNALYSLQDLIAPSEFKSYQELEARLNIVLGESVNKSPDDNYAAPAPSRIREESPFPTAEATITDESFGSDDEEASLNYFQNLADDDI